MTTQYAADAISEMDVLAFLTKINTWAQDLTPTERACLDAVFVRAAAAEDADVTGFLMRAQPYEPGMRPVSSPDSGPGGAGGGTAQNDATIRFLMFGPTPAQLAPVAGAIWTGMTGLP